MYYNEEIAKSLIESKKVKKGMSEDELIGIIHDYIKEDLKDEKKVRYLMGYDPDFLSDTITSINPSLIPLIKAFLSSSFLKGGDTFIKVLKSPISFSLSERLLIETPAENFIPSFLYFLITPTDFAEDS